MKKKKGFTLIELLAVIVILAIIALIATPRILNIVEETRRAAVKDSAYGYIHSIENKIAHQALLGNQYNDKNDYAYDEIAVDLKGTKPTEGMYSLKKGIVDEGVFCIDGYKVTYVNGIVEVGNRECTEADVKYEGSITLSSTTGNYTYPNSGTFEVIENISGGTLSCTSDNTSVATCSISGTTVTVKPGTTEGSATLTIKSAATDKYNEAQAAYVAVTAKGTLQSINANGYAGIYDGEAHGITVTAPNAIIKYGEEEGDYDLDESPKYSDVGEYTVYYEITSAGYNTITGSRQVVITPADGEITLEENSGIVEYNETKEIKITKNESNGEIKVTSVNTDIAEAKVEDGKLKITGKKIGKTTIIVVSEETHNYKEAETQYEVEVVKASNTLKISSTSGNYTYPESGTFTITENTSSGALTCTTSDSAVATCSISGYTVTVKPGTKEGSATLTIKAAGTDNYNGTQVSYVAITTKGTLNSYTVTGYSGVYDGKSHGITVTASDATIRYGTSSGNYTTTTNPTYTDVGEYTVYYEIEKEGYNTVTGSEKVVITKATGSVTAPTAKTLTYTGSSQALINAGSSSTGEIQYKLNDGSYSTSIPSAINAGTYTVYYRVKGDKNHTDVAEKSITVTIAKAILSYTTGSYTGVYDGESHGITVKSDGATIKYGTSSGNYTTTTNPTYKDVGTYIVYYQITREGYVTVTGSETVTITKANNTLTLSATTGNYTYPDSGTFTITENTSGGALSCTSDNTSVATCSISGTTVTVVPGKTAGSATLTIKSAATTNYNEGQAAHVATTAKGIIGGITANGYTGTYDGAAHGITVSTTLSGATIKYGTASGTYDKTASPTYTNAGTYTVYYQISKAGYTTVTGSKTITINKASGSATLSSTSGTIYAGNSTTFTVSGATGTLSCTSSNTSVATCSISGTTVTVKGVTAGSATITLNVASATNYNATSKTYSVTVKNKILSDVVKIGDYVSMTPTSTSYTTDTSKTGYSSTQTINPSELNLWRVIKINSDGTIEMVSQYVSSVKVYFVGTTGYKNLVGYLNVLASQYKNTKYTTKTRYIGYNGQTEYLTNTGSTVDSTSSIAPWTSGTSNNANESKGGGDVLYTTDLTLVKNAIGVSYAYDVSTNKKSEYWLASRGFFYNMATSWGYSARVKSTYEDDIRGMALWFYLDPWITGDYNSALRPIVTLKSGLIVTGSGTSGSPYKLN